MTFGYSLCGEEEALDKGGGEGVGDLGEISGVDKGEICKGVLTVDELLGEPLGVINFIEELGDNDGLIEGEDRTGLGSVEGEDLLGDFGDGEDPVLVLGKVAGDVLVVVEFTELRENFDKGVEVRVMAFVVVGIIGEDILVHFKGMKGDPLGGLFGGEDGGDFTGDFGKDFVSIVSFSKERFNCEGLL